MSQTTLQVPSLFHAYKFAYIVQFGNGKQSRHEIAVDTSWWSVCMQHGMAPARVGKSSLMESMIALMLAHSWRR